MGLQWAETCQQQKDKKQKRRNSKHHIEFKHGPAIKRKKKTLGVKQTHLYFLPKTKEKSKRSRGALREQSPQKGNPLHLMKCPGSEEERKRNAE
jgi:hypothetical protein